MQFSHAAVAAVLATAVSANYGYGYANSTAAVWVTDVVTAYTTYCPYATAVTLGGKTYTVTEATTLTITDCPCTISKPAYVTPIVSAKPVYPNSTVNAPSTAPAPAGTATAANTVAPASSTFTGAANRALAGSAAGLAGLLGLVAYAL